MHKKLMRKDANDVKLRSFQKRIHPTDSKAATNTKEIEHKRVLEGLGIQDLQLMHDISAATFENNGILLIEIIENKGEVSSSPHITIPTSLKVRSVG